MTARFAFAALIGLGVGLVCLFFADHWHTRLVTKLPMELRQNRSKTRVKFTFFNSFQTKFLAKVLASRQRARFADELPQVLTGFDSALRSGLTVEAALERAASQTSNLAGAQFANVTAQIRLGLPLQAALRNLANAMQNPDLLWLVTALEIHAETGGALVPVLQSALKTISARAQVVREVRIASAEGRMSSWVLTALPIFAFIGVGFVRPSYVQFFFSTTLGAAMFAGFIALMLLGWFWMRKSVRVRV